jgi:type IV secretory pathway TrbF-like protein
LFTRILFVTTLLFTTSVSADLVNDKALTKVINEVIEENNNGCKEALLYANEIDNPDIKQYNINNLKNKLGCQ